MRIGITGVNGFLGGAVYKSLGEIGHFVVSLDSITLKEFSAKRIEESNFTDIDWVIPPLSLDATELLLILSSIDVFP